MSNIVWIISTILIIIFSGLVFKELYSNNKLKTKNKSNILHPNRIFLIVGTLCSIGLLILVIIAWFLETSSSLTEKYIYASIIIAFAVLLGGYLIFFYLNYKIIIYEDYFIYQNFWRVKKKFYYKDIEINKTKIYPQVRKKLDNGKTKLIFKLAGVLDNEEAFVNAYKNWKNKPKSK